MKIQWPHVEAEKIIKKHGDLSKPIVCETGYGPSGFPHIGTFAEVARTCFVIEAVKQLKPEAKTRLIVFSDDMDGLRQVPSNMPGAEGLKEELGKPLSSIPDPHGEEASYSAYMNKQLKSFLDSFGFVYEFMSSSETYKAGIFDEGLIKLLNHYERVRSIFIPTIGEEKRSHWSPFFVICENCGRIYSTQVTGIDQDSDSVYYECTKSGTEFPSCGYKGMTEVTGGRTKVGWKIDWALRWYLFDVDYEMHGKDLLDSVTVSSQVVNILGKRPPTTYKYELFHDENGQKISKKLGNGLSMEQWLSYAPLGALIHFLLGNPNKPRKMGMPILPKIIDEYMRDVKEETTDEAHTSVWYLSNFFEGDSTILPKVKTSLTYSLLANAAEALGFSDGSLLFEYACQYDPVIINDRVFFQDLCNRVVDFVQEYQLLLPKEPVQVNESLLHFLPDIKQFILESSDPLDGNEIQKYLYGISKQNDLAPKQLFEFLYATLLKKQHGPRVAPFLALLGKAQAAKMLRAAIERFSEPIDMHADAIAEKIAALIPSEWDGRLKILPLVLIKHDEHSNAWSANGLALVYGPWPRPVSLTGYKRVSETPQTPESEPGHIFELAELNLSDAIKKISSIDVSFELLTEPPA